MPLYRKSDLERMAKGANQRPSQVTAKTLFESQMKTAGAKKFDIFLSHSFKDRNLIDALVQDFYDMGFTTYVDWIARPELDRSKVTKETAAILRADMSLCKCLFYYTTENAIDSKWMKWELGYFDGSKTRVAILPVLNSSTEESEFKGDEYLGLYPFIRKSKIEGKSKETLFVRTTPKESIALDEWIKP